MTFLSRHKKIATTILSAVAAVAFAITVVFGFAAPAQSARAATILFPNGGGTGWQYLYPNAVLLGNGSNRIATTSAGTNGNVLALVGGVPTWVATTTLANISGLLDISHGGTGTTTAPAGWLIYGGGGSAYQAVSTTTASCSGSASCTPFTVIGSSPVTISASGGSGGSGNVATSSQETAGYLPYWTSTNGTPATLGKVATTTLTLSGPFSTPTLPVVIGTSPITSTYYGLATTSAISQSQVLYGTSASGVASVATTSFSAANSTLTVTGTLGALIGGANSTISLNTGNANTWTALQQFGAAASSTQFSSTKAYFGGTATSTFDIDGALTLPAAAQFNGAGLTSCTGANFLQWSSGLFSCAAASAGSQTPWTQNIDGGGFNLANVGTIGIGTSSPYQAGFTVDSGVSSTTNTYHTGNVNGYLEVNIQNRSSGASASSDLVATANNGSPTTHYIDLGINGSGGGSSPFPTANHAYLFSIDDPLNIGALGASSYITFNTTGGTSAVERARLTQDGLLGIGTTTPRWALTVASSTGPQLTLTDTTATGAPFNFRTNGRYLTIGTSSPTTFATTTLPLLFVDSNSASTSVLRFETTGASTSTFSGGLQIKGAQASRFLLNDANKSVVTSGASSVLLNTLTDETGTGVAVFGTTPTFTTNITAPLVIGGTGAASTLTLKSTSGTGTSDAIIFQVGSNGATEAGRITTRGLWGIGTTTPRVGQLSIASTTGPQIALSNGSLTDAPWFMRSTGSTLYIGTSSPSTFASTTIPALTFLNTGLTGFGTSSPWAKLSLDAPAGIPAFAIGSSTKSLFTINSFGGITLQEFGPSTSTAMTIDWEKSGPQVLLQIGTAANTINIINATTSGQVGSRKLVMVCNPAGTASTITWSGVTWAGGTAPTQTTTASKCDAYSFFVSQGTSTPASPTYTVYGAATQNF